VHAVDQFIKSKMQERTYSNVYLILTRSQKTAANANYSLPLIPIRNLWYNDERRTIATGESLMSRVTKAVEHFSVEEVKQRMLSDSRPLYRQRWLIIYNALIDPRPAEEIARHCGVGKFTVQKLISRYNRFGISAVETKGKGGRKRQYLTVEQERQFLDPFFLRAKAGEIATVAEIHHAFEDRIAHEVDESTIYRLLQRHGWRKLVPRPRHPQAQEETQAAFKKTFPQKFKQ
jgi:transposase